MTKVYIIETECFQCRNEFDKTVVRIKNRMFGINWEQMKEKVRYMMYNKSVKVIKYTRKDSVEHEDYIVSHSHTIYGM